MVACRIYKVGIVCAQMKRHRHARCHDQSDWLARAAIIAAALTLRPNADRAGLAVEARFGRHQARKKTMPSPKIIVLILLTMSISSSALALQPSDTIKEWAAASAVERSALLQNLIGDRAGKLGILACLNETSQISGHSDLSIREVVKFCTNRPLAGEAT